MANTTDRVHQLPGDLEPSAWLLDTHYTFLEQRYGGWRAGVPPNNTLYTADHLTAVYFNNKVRRGDGPCAGVPRRARLPQRRQQRQAAEGGRGEGGSAGGEVPPSLLHS